MLWRCEDRRQLLFSSAVLLTSSLSARVSRWESMDTSTSSQLDSTLQDSVTDGEENNSDASQSPAASDQVHAHTQSCDVHLCHLNTEMLVETCYSSSVWDVLESLLHLWILICVGRYLGLKSHLAWPLSTCLMVRWCRSKGSSRRLRPLSYSHHKSRLHRWGHRLVFILIRSFFYPKW